MQATIPNSARCDYATYLGFQPGYASVPGIQLWNLTRQLGRHPACSTISEETLDREIAKLATAEDKVAEFTELRGRLE